MALRRSSLFFGGTALLTALAASLLLHARFAEQAAASTLAGSSRLVRELELTDLCLFTEASYTRHPAMTDFTTAFQDAPLSLEHFPTGSLLAAPPHLARTHGPRP